MTTRSHPRHPGTRWSPGMARPTHRKTVGAQRCALVGAVLAVLLLTGCATPAAAPPPTPRPAEPPPAATTSVASGPNATDTAWVQLMIPMTEQVLALLDLTPDHGADQELRELATRARTDHQATLDQLRQLRDRAGLPTTNVHAGHRMPGMLTTDDLAVLQQTRGEDFDRRFVAALRAHLDQAITLAQGEQRSGADQDTQRLAATVTEASTDQRARLDQLTGS